MSFGTPYPYGTPGGDEAIATPQLPPVYRVAQGNSVIVFLHVNGRLAERLRENVEDVVRVLGLTGTVIVAIIVREEGVVRDANAGDLDFQDGLTVTQIAPGVVTIEIGANEITTGMLQDALITAVKIADGNVTLAKLAANSVDASKIVDGSVGTNELANSAVTLAKLAGNSVDSSKIVDGSIVAADLSATAAVAYSQLEKPPGLTLVGTFPLTTGTALQMNNVFTTDYEEYEIEIEITNIVNAGNMTLRLCTGGTPNTSNVYYWSRWGWTSAGTTGAGGAGPATAAVIAFNHIATARESHKLAVQFPAQAAVTHLLNHVSVYNTPTNQGEIITAHFNGVTAFDGFQLFNSGGGNFTASAKVYGKG